MPENPFRVLRVLRAFRDSDKKNLCLFFYAVPTELKTGRITSNYKHIVPNEDQIINWVIWTPTR